ncbi:hypothetical protein [Parafilimonas sp.]|uniref:hypothetical protein n=1 Tax=Parafilimonas sp. TaxID=1969739 RepID=UPI0039E3D3A1
MTLSSLRIGNFFRVRSLYEEDEDCARRITEIRKTQVQADGKWVKTDHLIPVSITKQILLHAGFTQFSWITDAAVFECDYFKCTLDDNGVSLFCDNLKSLRPVKHLHELQNLYFDLTGGGTAYQF